ncbi:PepSY domain-containing protein [Nocardioides sp. 1609]|uniref:PepSY domain-containing protein n=1 Tax=Nocardioides sp. 1609 TaxID=2508327 RepID=UPI00106F635D|nr:PepSY domain-containing protein [Nocardioides sp. 1609]
MNRPSFLSPLSGRRLAVLAVAPLAFTLVACGGDDGDAAADDTAPASSASSSSPSSSGDSPAATDSSSAPADAPSDPSDPAAPAGDVLAAARTALGALDGAVVFSVALDRDGWDATVVTADGTEHDLTVGPDGSTVTRGPVEDRDDDGDDDGDDAGGDDDLAERQRLLQDATVDLPAAVQAALGEVPGGTVTSIDLDLDDDNGSRATWDVQLDEDTADEQTVTIDAVSGAVLRVERDD